MISGVFVNKESDVNSEAKIIGGHHDDPYILESIAGIKSCKNEIEKNNEKIYSQFSDRASHKLPIVFTETTRQRAN